MRSVITATGHTNQEIVSETKFLEQRSNIRLSDKKTSMKK